MVNGSLLYILSVAIISVNAQGFGYFRFGGPGLGYASPLQGPPGDFHNIALQSVTNRLYPEDLPQDLQNRLQDTLGRAELAFAGCESVAYWQYRRCTALELKNAIAEIKAIESEARTRLATTIPPPIVTDATKPINIAVHTAPAAEVVAAAPAKIDEAVEKPANEPAPTTPAPVVPATN